MTHIKTQSIPNAPGDSDYASPYGYESSGPGGGDQSVFTSSYGGCNAGYLGGNSYDDSYIGFTFNNLNSGNNCAYNRINPYINGYGDCGYTDYGADNKHSNHCSQSRGMFEEAGRGIDHGFNKVFVDPFKKVGRDAGSIGHRFIVKPIDGIGKGLGTMVEALVSPFQC